MKNILVLIALISCVICNSQESAVEVQQEKVNSQKKKSYLQRQIEDPTSMLYGQHNPFTDPVPKLTPIQQAELDAEVAKAIQVERQLEEYEFKLKEQAEAERLAPSNVFEEEKETETKQIISQGIKLNELKIEETKNKIIRDKILNYSIFLIVTLFAVYVIIRFLKLIKFKSIRDFFRNIWSNILISRISKLNRNEIYLSSFSIGLIFSVMLGNLFPVYDYYRLSRNKGQAIKVSERLSTYSIESFNYSVAIVTFLLVSLMIYSILIKANDEK